MNKICIISLFLLSTILVSTTYAYDYPSAYDFFISRKAEKNNNLPQYIKPDFIPIEFHLTSNFTYSIPANTFNMREMYATLGQTFHNDYMQITGFVTANGYFDTHDPAENYPYVKGNVGLYDGGIQAIFLDRILVAVRGRATFDINTNTFMLMPHYYDTTLDVFNDNAPFYTDVPGYYLPQNMNGVLANIMK